MKSQMTHRERILAAIQHQPTDRIPTDYWGVPEITKRLMKHFGVTSDVGLARALDIDMIMHIEPLLKPETKRRNMWNIEMRHIPIIGGVGIYEEPVEHPLAKFETIDEIDANYTWPTLEMFDYTAIKEQCERYRREGFAIEGGYISLTYFYEMIRGTEQMFVDFAENEEIANFILYKINEFANAHTRRILEESEGLIDISQVTDDLGSQKSLLMSKAMIDRYLGSYYRQNVNMVKSYDVKVFHHDDGAIMEIIPWIVENGCQVLNPLQWHLPGWDLHRLKREYGGQLCFHGGVDNQDVLPFGNAQDVKEEVYDCIEALYSDQTGYILAPCHNIQAITPIENILAMYEYAKQYDEHR